MKFKLSFWRVVFIVIMGLGLYSTLFAFSMAWARLPT